MPSHSVTSPGADTLMLPVLHYHVVVPRTDKAQDRKNTLSCSPIRDSSDLQWNRR